MSHSVIDELYQVICSRKNASADSSYVASLFAKGDNTILKKIGEECSEVIIAGKDKDRDAIIYECADLFFHLLVFLAKDGINFNEIELELQRRFSISGLEEKASRK